MNTLQINKILSQNRFSKDCFKGITPADKIIPYKEYPYALVANTDNYGEKGTHWVAFYVTDSESVEYFDSFALPPNIEISKFLAIFKNVRVNTTRIQAIYDISCGPHVIYFIIKRCMGISFDSIIKQLNHPFADTMVKMFVVRLLQ